MEIYHVQFIMDENTSCFITMNISSFVKFLEAFSKTFALEDSLFLIFSFYSISLTLIEHGIWNQVKVDVTKEFNFICQNPKYLQKFRTNIASKLFHKSK